MRAEYIVSVADKLCTAYGTRDPFEAADRLGVAVSFKDVGSLKGAYFGELPKPAIVINDGLDERMQRIVCAHELGHHMLHGSTQTCAVMRFDSTVSVLEREANVFAAEFLIDAETAKEYLRSGYTADQTAAIMETDVNLLRLLILQDPPPGDFLG